ncbi:DUF4209 domain-containing protein [Streptomyces anulatus]|uniref:DUF4209 domain-containing protein n=1 Tax=Streptomyces anulatus TaxID=1892 RepID=UPI00386CF1A6|nr:DUF4209 domain-containing protein [Streptomyces anulatus]
MPSIDAQLSSIADWIDSAALAETPLQAHREFNEKIPISEHEGPAESSGGSSATRRAAAWAFAYHVQVVENDGKWRVQIVPYFQGPDSHSIPPQVSDVSDFGVEIWTALSAKTGSHFGKARLHHLLFDRKVGKVREHAILAAQSYLKLAGTWEKELDKGECLNIALRLARAVGKHDLADNVVSEMLTLATNVIAGDTDKPGAATQILGPLISERVPPKALHSLLDAAIDRYDSPFIKSQFFGLKLRLHKGNVARSAIYSDLVQMWLDAAATATGLIRAGHLKTALQHAQASAVPHLIDRAASSLQALRNEDLGLKSLSASSAVSREEFESYLKPVIDCTDWRQALLHFAFTYGPATGSIENTRSNAAEYAKHSVLADLATMELIGADGLPRYSPQSDAEIEEVRLTRQESFTLQHMAPLLAIALHRIAETHGVPTEEDLTSFFAQGELTDPELAASIARCFIRYWSGDTEGATFTIAPKVETLARNLVLALDAGVYTLQRNEKPGQYPGLGYLLGVLRKKDMDESWYRSILTICGNPAGGWNLRNEIAHGFIPAAGSPAAALLFQCVIYLWGLGAKSQNVAAGVEAEEDQA